MGLLFWWGGGAERHNKQADDFRRENLMKEMKQGTAIRTEMEVEGGLLFQ
jgi:hypothetical protein